MIFEEDRKEREVLKFFNTAKVDSAFIFFDFD